LAIAEANPPCLHFKRGINTAVVQEGIAAEITCLFLKVNFLAMTLGIWGVTAPFVLTGIPPFYQAYFFKMKTVGMTGLVFVGLTAGNRKSVIHFINSNI